MTAIKKLKKSAIIVPLVLVAVTIIFIIWYDNFQRQMYPTYYSEYVEMYAEEYEIDPDIIFAVIRTESDFRPTVVSKSGAIGLMQIMPGDTLNDINIMLGENYTADDLNDPQINIRCGVCYLNYLYKRFSDWEITYAAYNGGPSRVAGWLLDNEISKDGKLVNIPIEQTRNYVIKVRNAAVKYEKIYDGSY